MAETIRALVITGDPNDLKLVQKAFTGEADISFETEGAATLEDALKRLETGGINVIVLDLNLPDSRGLQTFERIHEKFASIPTVVLSEADDEQLAFNVVRKGAQDYLVKGRVYDKVILRVTRYALERKRTEEDLRRSRELYRTLVRYLPQTAVFLFDHDLRIQAAEGDALIVGGLNRDTLEGRRLSETFDPGVLEELEPHYRAALAGRKSSFELALGGRVYLCTAVPLEESGRVTRGLAMAVDITGRKRLEEAKDEFVNNVSHELRTPLAMIKEGVSQVLDGSLGDLTADQKRFLFITHENTLRLGRIINELLDMSRIEAGKMDLRRELTDIVAVARFVAATFAPQIGKKAGLKLRESYSAPSIPLYVDKDRITQIFVNLVGNALKFTKKGSIEIAVKDRKHEVECRVTDTGKGIAPGNLDKLFQKFRQLDREEGPGAHGTGLGLAITKGLVELHHGRLSVKSTVTKGSTFTFVLPKFTSRKLFTNYLSDLLKQSRDGDSVFSVLFFNVTGGGTMAPRLEELVRRNLRQAGDKTVVKDESAFLVILPDTLKNNALMAAGRFQQICEDFLAKRPGPKPALTCSIAAYPEDASTEEEFLNKVLW